MWKIFMRDCCVRASGTSLGIIIQASGLDKIRLESLDNLSAATVISTKIGKDEKIDAKQLTSLTKDVLNKRKDKGLSDALTKRRKAMVDLMETNPGAVLENTLPDSLKSTIPAEVAGLLEKNVTIEGTLEAFVEDYFEQGYAKEVYNITETKTGKKYKLHFSEQTKVSVNGKKVKNQNKPNTGDKVKIKVKGVALDDNIAVTETDQSSAGTQQVSILGNKNSYIAAAGEPSAPVKKNVAVILFNWQNDTRTPYTVDQARATMFGNTNSVNAYYKEVSYGALELTGVTRSDGDVYGWVTIPYNLGTTCPWSSWRDAAYVAVQAGGANLTAYDNIQYNFPTTSACGFGGIAGINGSYSLINYSSATNVSLRAHELGHNLNMNHANALNCYDTNSVRVSVSNNCFNKEYADVFDVMGSTGAYHLNAYHKGQATSQGTNWLSAANTQTVSTSGTYAISPIENYSTGAQVLRIPKAFTYPPYNKQNVGYYYIEYRQPIGFDVAMANTYPASTNGVLIHLSSAYDNSAPWFPQLVDATPQTTTFADASLGVGKTLSDSIAGINITLLSLTPSVATVQVTISAPLPCAAKNPSIYVLPGPQKAQAGETLGYTVEVINNDNQYCQSSTFNINSTFVYPGWTQVPSQMSVTLVPGESVTKSILVTSPTTAYPHNYDFNEYVIDANNSSRYAQTKGYYEVYLAESIPPVINSFAIQYTTLNSSNPYEAVYGTWNVTDAPMSSYLERIEVYYAVFNSSACNDANQGGCSWQFVGAVSAPYHVSSWNTGSNYISLGGVSAGTYYFAIKAQDKAGNKSTQSQSIKVTKTTAPPDPTLSLTKSGTGSGTITSVRS